MSSVCGGRRPRERAIKKKQKNHRAKLYCTTHRVDSPGCLSARLILPFLLSFFAIRLSCSQGAPRYARPHENSINTAGRNGGIFWSKHGDAACRYMFYVKPRSPGLRPRSPLFLGTQRWTCATHGRRLNNKSRLLAFHFGPGGLRNLIFAQLRDKSHNEGGGCAKLVLRRLQASQTNRKAVYTKQLTTPLGARRLYRTACDKCLQV